ncbi:MAG: hypothetical protein QW594_03280, partial [Candidatus Woesearchaeota archaeon]
MAIVYAAKALYRSLAFTGIYIYHVCKLLLLETHIPMAFGDLFKKKKVDFQIIEKGDHKTMLVNRAKMLIEELVSPLDEPNQQLIEELLTIIAQTSAMPPTMVNKEEVLKTTKVLLYQIIKPIPNPNKK